MILAGPKRSDLIIIGGSRRKGPHGRDKDCWSGQKKGVRGRRERDKQRATETRDIKPEERSRRDTCIAGHRSYHIHIASTVKRNCLDRGRLSRPQASDRQSDWTPIHHDISWLAPCEPACSGVLALAAGFIPFPSGAVSPLSPGQRTRMTVAVGAGKVGVQVCCQSSPAFLTWNRAPRRAREYVQVLKRSSMQVVVLVQPACSPLVLFHGFGGMDWARSERGLGEVQLGDRSSWLLGHSKIDFFQRNSGIYERSPFEGK